MRWQGASYGVVRTALGDYFVAPLSSTRTFFVRVLLFLLALAYSVC